MSPRALTGGRTTLDALNQRLEPLRSLRGPVDPGFPDRVREVVLIASSSRGGSSMLAETLRHSRPLLHLSAEINPFLRLAGFGRRVYEDTSDRLTAADLEALDPALRAVLGAELAQDVGTAVDMIDDESYAYQVAWRLTVQWPELPLDPLHLSQRALDVLRRVRAREGWAPGELPDVPGYFLALLRELGRDGVSIDPWYYDLPRSLLRETAPDGPTRRAPAATLVEEPPFVVPRPWERATPDTAHRPLVIKTPSNVHRLGFLRALFPAARFRLVHLTRNPAAAVNGLYDGWLHHGFHAHRMAEPLRIEGYVEHCPDNRWWWKFDLPPGWARYTSAPLPEVCAFQWRSAHRAVLDHLVDVGTETLTVRFEDLIQDAHSRLRAFGELSDWLGVSLEGRYLRAVREGIGPVVATATPGVRRWRTRADVIEKALGAEDLALAEQLGYGDPDTWI
ncbi:sulfotransferase [Streptomyces sp. NPDC060053]|uniref:sulfotransferase n=1 Tax=Streptomyces sp. NPDC060053 TaxID=3347047 RepID=UPI0036C12812